MKKADFIREEIARIDETARAVQTAANAQLQLLQAQKQDAEARLKAAEEEEKKANA